LCSLYCKYGISYQDLVEMMQERGVEVDPSTIMRWVHRYAPEIEKRVRWYQGYRVASWRVDETYVRVGGQWKYLFRAVDKHGRLIDFMLTDRRNTRAAHRFLGKALKIMRHWPPSSITTDQLGSYPKAICRLQREGKLSADKTSDLQIPEQHHRSGPWRTQANHSTDTRLSDHEDGVSDHQGLRSHADDPSRALPRRQNAHQRRGAFRQQAI
jgi:transposase-like protein